MRSITMMFACALGLSAQCAIQTQTFPDATVAVPYQKLVLTTGCSAPTTWTVVPGDPSCPAVAVDPTTNLLTATFTSATACPFTLTGTDSSSTTTSMQFIVGVKPACSHTPVMSASGEILVYRNGILQKVGDDYSLSTGSLPTITFIVPVDPSDLLSTTLLRSFVLITKVQGNPWTGVGYRAYREDWRCGVGTKAAKR